MTEEKVFNFEFSEAEANAIIAGLNQLPHGQVRGLVDKIIATAQKQHGAPTEDIGTEDALNE